jgi:SAM-dependent methyltransferase
MNIENIQKETQKSYFIDPFITNKHGKVFEIGCGASSILLKCALLNWEVSGIDYQSTSLSLLEKCLHRNDIEPGILIHGDVFEYDPTTLYNSFDLMMSYGFFEHFKNPTYILKRWSPILKEGGFIITEIPNLFSFNAWFLKKCDKQTWDNHIAYTPNQIDQFHIDAGLEIVEKAFYTGGYDVNMLFPWDKVMEKIDNKIIYKLTRYFSYFCVDKFLNLLPKNNKKFYNPLIVGVYQRSKI